MSIFGICPVCVCVCTCVFVHTLVCVYLCVNVFSSEVGAHLYKFSMHAVYVGKIMYIML